MSFIPFVDLEKSDPPGTKPFAEDVDERIAIEETLLKVTHEQRTCMVLHFVGGLRYKEIAQITGASEEAVRKRVARGSQEFRKAYPSVSGGQDE